MSLAPAPAAFLDAAPAQGWRRWATPRLALLAIAAAYSLVVLTQVIWFDYLTHDEVVYASQFARGAHPMYMSAPRAWGMPLLMAPVDMFTTSIQVMRIYLGILAGVGLYLAFHPWLRVSAAWVAPIAAGLFVTLWTSILYGALAYPNLWLGFALVAGIGWAWRALDDGGGGGDAIGSPGASDGRGARRVLVWLVVAFGFASMVRPIDAGIVAVPLLAFLAWRRARGPLLSVAVGLSIGVGAWVVESFVRFGDPIDRLRQGADNVGAGVGLTVVRLLEAVDGPQFLCRPAERCSDIHLLEVLWWLALPVLTVLGILAARRRWPYLLPVAGAALLTTSYAVLSDWSNTRFLQPGIPVARAARRAWCPGRAPGPTCHRGHRHRPGGRPHGHADGHVPSRRPHPDRQRTPAAGRGGIPA